MEDKHRKREIHANFGKEQHRMVLCALRITLARKLQGRSGLLHTRDACIEGLMFGGGAIEAVERSRWAYPRRRLRHLLRAHRDCASFVPQCRRKLKLERALNQLALKRRRTSWLSEERAERCQQEQPDPSWTPTLSSDERVTTASSEEFQKTLWSVALQRPWCQQQC
eukprot:5550944-Amphidinium_carterae.1